MAKRSVLEDALIMMLWAADTMSRPTFYRMTESFESWEYRNGLRRELACLEARNLLARRTHGEEMVCTLTDLGRLEALGGKDMVARWNRSWDGIWRQILFDLPSSRKAVRIRLWRWLKENGFGYLQNSVWIHPDPVYEVAEALQEFRDDVETFVVMEARCVTGYSNESVVNGAWDFEEINKRYKAHMEAATLSNRELENLRKSPESLGRWLRNERAAWSYALMSDPLLPRALLPKEYLGEVAWSARLQSYRQLGKTLRW
jgi:phenylacetic acid degradation operon negative regulatory protein